MLARARILLLLAFVAGCVIIAAEFPFAQLLSEHASVNQAASQLNKLDAANKALQSQVAQMKNPATIGNIAHQDYGLVQKGERSIVVLPGGGTGGGGPLSSTGIPPSAIIPSDSLVSGTPVVVHGVPEGFWTRLVKRLEFWNAVP